MTTRRDDWQVRLAEYLEACARRRFRWGEWDCALLAADAVESMTGVDWASQWRGQYKDAESARGLLASRGHQHLSDLATECLGHPLDDPQGQRGNVVAIQPSRQIGALGEALGIVMSDLAVAPAARRGLVFVPRSQWLKEWRV